MFRKMLAAAAFVAVTSTFAIFSQTQSSAEDKPANPAAAESADKTADTDVKAGIKTTDHLLATSVALGNHGEIAVSEIARTKSENDDVKKFAEMMIKEHHAFLEKLHKFAPDATKAGFLDGAVKEARTKGDKKRADIVQTAAEDKNNDAVKSDEAVKTADHKSHHGFNHMQLERELAAQCLASAKQALDEKSGAEFDQCYIGHQLAMHGFMKDKLIVLQRHVSPELASILAEGQKTTEEHLEKAEELMKGLASHSTTRTVETKRDGKVKERKVTREKE